MEARANNVADILARARDYPYAVPGESYIYRAEGVAAFDPAARRGRTPVLAYGSNRSPVQLRRKFGHDPHAEIPVERARLADHDVVFSAHISRYGAVPATILAAPGTSVLVAVTWLDGAQLALMHESEVGIGNYEFAQLDGKILTLDSGDGIDRVHVYRGARGYLLHDGGAVALRAVRAEGRVLPQSSAAQILEVVRARLAPDAHPDAFVLRLAEDGDYRRASTAALGADAGEVAIGGERYSTGQVSRAARHQARQAAKS